MEKENLIILQNQFDSIVQKIPEESIEYWFARDLQIPLGYDRWENFLSVINKAIEACKQTGYETYDHFRKVTKMVQIGNGSERPIDDKAKSQEKN